MGRKFPPESRITVLTRENYKDIDPSLPRKEFKVYDILRSIDKIIKNFCFGTVEMEYEDLSMGCVNISPIGLTKFIKSIAKNAFGHPVTKISVEQRDVFLFFTINREGGLSDTEELIDLAYRSGFTVAEIDDGLEISAFIFDRGIVFSAHNYPLTFYNYLLYEFYVPPTE
jgi:hypothetical protein